ncbi:MAG: hypothetical protein PF795_12010, partial [Kiritimatiellae bacterium]|nr:hypothetical protein [Kiritimatiellia bacterium]
MNTSPGDGKPDSEETEPDDSDEDVSGDTCALDAPCCGDDSDGSDPDCLNFRLSFPILPLETRLGSQAFQINRTDPTPSLFTPQSLSYTSLALTYVFHINSTENLPAGVSRKVQLTDRKNVPVTFQVSDGESIGYPVNEFTNRNVRIQLLDAQKQPVTGEPAFYRLFLSSGGQIDYPAVRGATPAFYRDANGREIDLNQLLGGELHLATQAGTFRQIKSEVGLADIIVTDDFGYEIRLYTPDNVGALIDGLYYPQGQPYRTIRIENPTGDLNRSDKVRITDTHGAYSRSDEFTYVPAAEDWELTEGQGDHRRTEQLQIEEDPETGHEIKTRSVRDNTDSLISKETLVIKTYPWNKAVIEKIQDPEGMALTTTYAYYVNPADTGRYGRIRLYTRPDGSWVRYNYDSEGRTTQKIRPWQDTTPDADPADAVETTFDYTPVDPGDTPILYDVRPRTVITKTLGEETSRIYYAYVTDPVTGEYSKITETASNPGAAYGAPGNLRTVRTYYASDDDFIRSGRLKSVLRPDHTLELHEYEEVEEDDETLWVETTSNLVSQAGVATPINGKSTRTVRTRDLRGNIVREVREVYVQAAWQPLTVQIQTYSDEISNGRNQLLTLETDGIPELTQTWEGPLLTSRIDRQGITTKFEYDSLDRIEFEYRHADTRASLNTHYHRTLGAISCGCDGARTVTRSAGDLSLTTRQTTDAVGRRAEVENEVGAITTFTYQLGGRITTQTNPDGSTVIIENYLDGRTKSVTGTGTVHQYFEYDVNTEVDPEVDPDGTQWTRVYSGPDGINSPMWQQTTTNMLGQTIENVTQAFLPVSAPPGAPTTLVTTMEYNAMGQLVKSIPPFGPATHYEYNDFGQQERTWQDVNDNDTLDLAGPDRIQESTVTQAFLPEGETDYWSSSKSYIYNHGQATPTLVSTQRNRLTGLGTPHPDDVPLGLLVSESVTIDIHGNETTSLRYINRDLQTVYMEQHSPYSDTPATSLAVGGLLLEQTDTAGITTGFDYDALERRVGITDARIGRSFVTLATDSNLVLSQTDADGNTTLFDYDDIGRRISVTDPEGKTTHTAYTADGQVAATWGATYPVVYEYDDYDRMAKLHTLRDTEDEILFNPTPDDNGILLLSSISSLLTSMDTTTWTYDEATGLLEQKLYDDGTGPAYTYTPDGRLETRTWARSFP